MSFKERLSILIKSEISELYGVPQLSLEQKRVVFALVEMMGGGPTNTLREVRRSVKGLALSELEKELRIHRHIRSNIGKLKSA